MARPTPFDRQTSFTQFSSQFPAKPQNGASLDAEFNAVKVAIDETQSNLALIQDDDGKLARGSVGRAQFDSSITLGFESPSAWAPDTSYTAETSTVFYQAKFYSAIETHVSGDTFALEKWFEIADLSASVAIEDGSITDAKLATSAATAEKIAPLAVTTPKIAAAAVTNAKIADEAVTLAKLASTLSAELRDLIIPVGLGPVPFSGRTAPDGWVLAGATYNRADWPGLWAFAAAEIASGVNDIYGVGDGDTTFTIKSFAARAIVGVDAAEAVVAGLTKPGATIGAKEITLVRGQLPAFKPEITITDPGHQHPYTKAGPSPAWQPGSDNAYSTGAPNLTSAAVTGISAAFTDNLGSGEAHSNMQPSIAVNFIIKAA